VSAVLYRPSESTDVLAMAHIRAREWGSFEYWANRISGYLEGEINPQRVLPPRTCCVAVERSSVVGFVAGHLARRYGCEGEWEWIKVIRERRGAHILHASRSRNAEPTPNTASRWRSSSPRTERRTRFTIFSRARGRSQAT
jgi:hypothetical protein